MSGSDSPATLQQAPSFRARSGFATATAVATAAVAGLVAIRGIADPSSGIGVAVLAIALGGWAIAMLLDRPASLRHAATATLAATMVQIALARGASDPLAGVLAAVALAACVGALGRVLARDRFARPATGIVAASAATYVAVANLIASDARLADMLAAVAALLPISVALLLAHRIDWGRRPPPAQAMALCGIGILGAAIAGAIAGAPFLVGFGMGGAVMPAESAACIALMLCSFVAAVRDRRRLAIALLAPVGVISLLAIASRELTLASALDAAELQFSVGWWLERRLQPVAALVMCGAAAMLCLSILLARHRMSATIRWTGGVMLCLIALLSLLASGTTDDTVIAMIGAHRGAVPGVLGSLALGIALLLHEPQSASRRNLRTVWLPVFAALLIAAVAVQFYRMTDAAATLSLRRESEAAATGVEAAIRASLADRIDAVERFGERLLSVSRAERSDLFAIEAAQAVQAGVAIQSLAWVDADRKVLEIVAADGSTRLIGSNAAFEPKRVDAYATAGREARAVAIGPVQLAGSSVSAVLVIIPGAFSDGRTEFLVAALRIDELLSTALRNFAVGQQIVVDTGSGRAFARDLSLAARPDRFPTVRSFAVLGSDWTLRMEPLPSPDAIKGRTLRQTLLWFGILIAALVSMALRFAAIARERATAAEAASNALRAEIDAREHSEQALVRSESIANRLLEGMSDAVFTLDCDLRVRYVNAAGRRLVHGLTDDPIGLPVHQIFPQFQGSEFATQFRRVIEQERPSSIEAYSVGIHRWLSGRMYPVDGGMTGIFADTTEVHRARRFESDQRAVLVAIATGKPLAECIAMSILLYEGRFDGTVCAVLRFDAMAGHFHGAIAPSLPAEAGLAWEGVMPGPAAGSCGSAVLRGERVITADIATDPAWQAFRDTAIALGLRACWSQPIRAADGVVLGTFAVYHKEPREPTAEESTGIDSVAALVGIALGRDRSARQIEESQQRFRSLFERSPSSVFAYDLDGRIIDCNDIVLTRSGLPREALIGRMFDDLIAADQREFTREKFLAAAAGETQTYETVAELPDGRVRSLQVSNIPIVVEGSIVGVYGVVNDVTEARGIAAELDRALHDVNLRNRELQDFAFVASHDLQEPLRKVQAFSDRVIKRFADQLDPQGVDYLQRIDSAAHRMQVLIDDLLAYSRITSQGQPFVLVDLDQVLREALSDLEIRIDESAAKIVVGTLPQVMGDRTQMRQLLQNLLANALKFRAAERTPRISVAACTPDDAPGCVRLVVEDNGIGFESIYSERIFGPFQRLHGRHEYDGTGIGLAVVRKIVERHGGRIVAIGQPGLGARFEITLPVRAAGRMAPA
jgi:PAS domain S-box-containing protein